jgi:hypothetical protein
VPAQGSGWHYLVTAENRLREEGSKVSRRAVPRGPIRLRVPRSRGAVALRTADALEV